MDREALGTLLLHSCCASCAVYPFELLKENFNILSFFSNSNIQPEDEYRKRLESFNLLCKQTKTENHIDEYLPHEWLKRVNGLENEPERGIRCEKCFYLRLQRAFEFSKIKGIKYITTTLTLAPYKVTSMVFEVARKLSQEYGIEFLEFNFKKNDGYKKSRELSKNYGLYMQNYCGCIFSLNDRRKKEKDMEVK